MTDLNRAKLPKPWTIKQYDFCMAYLSNGANATEAAIKAGYSQKTAKNIGSQNLAKLHISAFIAEKAGAAGEKQLVSVNDTLEHQIAMGHSNIMDFLGFDSGGRPFIDLQSAGRIKARAVKSIEITELPPITTVMNGQEVARECLKVKLTLWDKPKANEILMKYLGLLKPDNINVNINNKLTVNNISEVEMTRRLAFMLAKGAVKPPKVPLCRPDAVDVQAKGGGNGSPGTTGSTVAPARPAKDIPPQG